MPDLHSSRWPLVVCCSAAPLSVSRWLRLARCMAMWAKSIPIFAQFLMLLTPVVYPARTDGLAGLLATWNPISPLMVTARETLSAQALTLVGPFATITLISAVAAMIGLVTFRIAMPHLIARMGG
jgi:ABC-type polysaccharide/polyol phosphate export permease